MCGIAGYFVSKGQEPSPLALHKLSQNLLEGIQSRGRDASGYAFVSAVDKHVKLAKAPVNASTFLGLPGHLLSKDRVVKSMPQSMILHARAATKGDPVNNWNNHPVYSKASGLCLIHNGWLINDDDLVEEFKLRPDAQVDTEAYLRLVEQFYINGNQKSMEKAIIQATAVSYGAIACAMIQGGRKGVMWLWKDDGQISLAKVDWGWIFASTTDILVKAIVAMQGKTSAADTSFFKVAEVGKGTILRFAQGESVKQYSLEGVDWEKLPSRYSNRVTRFTSNAGTTVRRAFRNNTFTGVSRPGMFNEYDNYEDWWNTATNTRVTSYDSRTGGHQEGQYESYGRRHRGHGGSTITPPYGSTFLPSLSRSKSESKDGDKEGSTNSGVAQTPAPKETKSNEGEKGKGDKAQTPTGESPDGAYMWEGCE